VLITKGSYTKIDMSSVPPFIHKQRFLFPSTDAHTKLPPHSEDRNDLIKDAQQHEVDKLKVDELRDLSIGFKLSLSSACFSSSFATELFYQLAAVVMSE